DLRARGLPPAPALIGAREVAAPQLGVDTVPDLRELVDLAVGGLGVAEAAPADLDRPARAEEPTARLPEIERIADLSHAQLAVARELEVEIAQGHRQRSSGGRSASTFARSTPTDIQIASDRAVRQNRALSG